MTKRLVEFEVDKIIASKIENEVELFQVIWKGYPDKKDYTWEEKSSLKKCPEALEAFYKRKDTPKKGVNDTPKMDPKSGKTSEKSTNKRKRSRTPPRSTSRNSRSKATSQSSPTKTATSSSSSKGSPARTRRSTVLTKQRSPASSTSVSNLSFVSSPPAKKNKDPMFDEKDYDAYLKKNGIKDTTDANGNSTVFGKEVIRVEGFLFGNKSVMVRVRGLEAPVQLFAPFVYTKWPNLAAEALTEMGTSFRP